MENNDREPLNSGPLILDLDNCSQPKSQEFYQRLSELKLRGSPTELRETNFLSAPNGTSNAVGEVYMRGMMFGEKTRALADHIESMSRDPSIDAIVLNVNSPGGYGSGIEELGDSVARAAERKPVVAHVEDVNASAAYWVASQASEIYSSSKLDRHGSIGTYTVLHDTSQLHDKMGIEPIVVSSGGVKGAATDGVKISDEVVAQYQGIVDSTNDLFIKSAARGRSMDESKMRELGDGRTFVSEDAVKLGLIDGIKTKAELLESLSQNSISLGVSKMSQPVQATLEDINAFCGDAPSDWKLAQLESHISAEDVPAEAIKFYLGENQRLVEESEALKASSSEVEAKIAEKDAEIARLTTEVSDLTARLAAPAGNEPVGGGTQLDDQSVVSATKKWNEGVSAKVAEGFEYTKAVAALAKEQPELHQQFIAEYNS